MTGLIAAVFAILLDPIIIILRLISGYFNRSMAILVVCATIVAIFHEAILFAMQSGRVFDPVHLLIGVGAALLWGLPTFLGTKKKKPEDL